MIRERRPESVDVHLNNDADLSRSDVSNALHRATHYHIDDFTISLEDGIVGKDFQK